MAFRAGLHARRFRRCDVVVGALEARLEGVSALRGQGGGKGFRGGVCVFLFRFPLLAKKQTKKRDTVLSLSLSQNHLRTRENRKYFKVQYTMIFERL